MSDLLVMPRGRPRPGAPDPMIGVTFGRLTVIRKVGSYYGQARYECSCACGGTLASVRGYSLRTGETRSCGCLTREQRAQAAHLSRSERRRQERQQWARAKAALGCPRNQGIGDWAEQIAAELAELRRLAARRRA